MRRVERVWLVSHIMMVRRVWTYICHATGGARLAWLITRLLAWLFAWLYTWLDACLLARLVANLIARLITRFFARLIASP